MLLLLVEKKISWTCSEANSPHFMVLYVIDMDKSTRNGFSRNFNWASSFSTAHQDDEPDYHDSRRHRRRFEDDLEMDTRAEKRIFNVKKV